MQQLRSVTPNVPAEMRFSDTFPAGFVAVSRSSCSLRAFFSLRHSSRATACWIRSCFKVSVKASLSYFRQTINRCFIMNTRELATRLHSLPTAQRQARGHSRRIGGYCKTLRIVSNMASGKLIRLDTLKLGDKFFTRKTGVCKEILRGVVRRGP